MQISRNLATSLSAGLTEINSESSLDALNGCVENSNVVKAFITLSAGSYFIPLVVLDNLILTMYTDDFRPAQGETGVMATTKDIVFPLYVGRAESHRTTDSVLKALCLASRLGRLMKVTTSKDEVFYGGHGIILEEDGTPILLAQLAHELSNTGTLDSYKGQLYISPKVFSMDNLVYKGIISKVIPTCLALANRTIRPIEYKICIEDIPGVSKPRLINNSMRDSSRLANQFLKDHIDHVFD